MSASAVEAARDLAGALEQALSAMPSGARADAERALRRLQDVVLPRLEEADAPLLVVVGGSTGAGKSTLVNSLLDRTVSRAGAVRPTTRRPVLVCAPQARSLFMSDRVLPRLAKHEGGEGTSLDAVTITVDDLMWPSMGILDAPDIDSVEEGNRRLASELLDGADLWIFVTSAARYADAVAWTHLEEAAARGLRVSIVLNRVPPGAAAEIRADLASLVQRRGLGEVPIIVITEQSLTDGRLPIDAIYPVGSFLEGIGHDAQERAVIVRRALTGAVAASFEESDRALDASRDSCRAVDFAREELEATVVSRAHEVASSSSDDVLRGEVSARIAEVLGSWDMTRTFSRVVASVRQRIVGAVRGMAAPEEQVRRDLTGGVAQRLGDSYHRAWNDALRLAASVGEADGLEPMLDADGAAERARHTAQEWTSEVTNIVRGQAQSSRVSGRLLAGGINVVTLSLMVSVFAMTGGVTGVEVGVAGASAALSQTILESYFGERTVRALATQAREALERLAADSLTEVVAPVATRLDNSREHERIDALESALATAREALV